MLQLTANNLQKLRSARPDMLLLIPTATSDYKLVLDKMNEFGLGKGRIPTVSNGAPLGTPEILKQCGADIIEGSLAAMMRRRYEAYKSVVVKPFFKDHFARLDRQIVLVDALAALNSGPAAVRDLESALAEVLTAFRTGRSNLLSQIFRPKIDKILFVATKADHLHQHLRSKNIHVMGNAGRLRVAIHGYNTHEDVETLIRELKTALAR